MESIYQNLLYNYGLLLKLENNSYKYLQSYQDEYNTFKNKLTQHYIS